MNNDTKSGENIGTLSKYLSPIGAWALAFGCSVGWGAFVMPGTTFLPKAGPVGTAIGMCIGLVLMLIIGINYHYLMNRYPDSGGTLTYTVKVLGYDHGFLSSWFLVLVYVAIIWANATALTLIARRLFGDLLQFGFHYQILGYDVYFGEVLLTEVALVLFGFISIWRKRLSIWIQIILAVLLIVGIVVVFVCVMQHAGGVSSVLPAFADNDGNSLAQIIGIVVLAPWAFVGFESISHSTEEFRFPTKRALPILVVALVTGAVSYIFLTEIAAAVQPNGYSNWISYIADLPDLDGLQGLPTFFATNEAMGHTGIIILGVTIVSGIITGLIGNFIAASRLMYSMADRRILPRWFGAKDKNGTPRNAIVFLIIISLFIPFLGRTAIGWIVDVTTIGAAIAYGYTSIAAFVMARREGDTPRKITGLVGIFAAVLFFVYFMAFSAGAMSTESYLILAVWAILGFVYFRYVFSKDEKRRFGKSTVVWLALLFLLFFTSLMWVRQATNEMTERVVNNISEYYEMKNPEQDPEAVADTESYLESQMDEANRLLTRNSIIQMLLIVAGLAIMFSVYVTITKREKAMEVKKAKAEESSKAKTIFLSNMSHDIRTPMNAIIGYVNLAEDEKNDEAKLREYLGKIKNSSHHLLALINDVLEMSRIESGKMDLEPIAIDLKKTLGEVEDMFSTQMDEKHIDFSVSTSHIKDSSVMCDKNRLNRVLLNLLSNAYKFTPEGGTVTVQCWQIDTDREGVGTYELRVKDSGIGMTKEFAERVFDAFERERTSTVSGIQGTGLGMAITKSIVDMMGGSIEVNTAPDEGTEFVIRLDLELVEEKAEVKRSTAKVVSSTDGSSDDETVASEDPAEDEIDFSTKRLLLVEDIDINREIATMILTNMGFSLETAVNGQDAVDKVAASEPGYFDGVLMDIQMPVMDGYEASRTIRALDDEVLSQVPIVAMTANAFSEDVKKAHDAGMNGHVAKPIDVKVLESTLREVLS